MHTPYALQFDETNERVSLIWTWEESAANPLNKKKKAKKELLTAVVINTANRVDRDLTQGVRAQNHRIRMCFHVRGT